MFGTRRPPGSGDHRTPGGPSPSHGGEPGRVAGPAQPPGQPPGQPPLATSRRSEPPRSAEPPRRGGYALPGTRPRDPGRIGETPAAAERQLVVGREISLSGEIKACEKLVVEGQVKADLKDCKVLYITSSGLYEGAAVVDDADISGRFDGDLTVKGTLMLRASGRVSGTLRYAELEIERGGRVSGTLEDIPAPAAGAPAGTAPTPSPSEKAEAAASKAPKAAAGAAAKAAPRAAAGAAAKAAPRAAPGAAAKAAPRAAPGVAPGVDDDLVARARKPGSSAP